MAKTWIRVEDTESGDQFDVAKGPRLDKLIESGAVVRVEGYDEHTGRRARSAKLRTDKAGESAPRKAAQSPAATEE